MMLVIETISWNAHPVPALYCRNKWWKDEMWSSVWCLPQSFRCQSQKDWNKGNYSKLQILRNGIFLICLFCWVASGHIYRCVLPPSSRWCLLNGGIISVTSLLGFKWKDTPSMVWRLIVNFVTPCHWWRADGLVLTRWFIQSWVNPRVILVYHSSSMCGRAYMHISRFISCPLISSSSVF